MAVGQQPLVTLDIFKGDFRVAKLISKLSDQILDQHEARIARTAATRSTNQKRDALPFESLVAVDQLHLCFERADKELQALRRDLDARVEELSRDVGEAEDDFQAQIEVFEESVQAMSAEFQELDAHMSSVTSVATKFGDRLQNTDNYRRNAEDAIQAIHGLQEFANIESFDELSDFYTNDNNLAEAAALTRRMLDLATELTRASKGVSLHGNAEESLLRNDKAETGTLDYAVQQLEGYRNELENRVVSRFDKAESRRDLADMAECARIMQEFERQASGNGSLVQRYISTRSMFIDPKELALGVSEPVVDTNTALAAKRRLGTMYKSITHAVRHEAALMSAVFARPMEAITAFVHRLFEQRIQMVLTQMLTPPPPEASKEHLEAYLKLLAEAYQSTCNLARNLQELVRDADDVMEHVEAAFSETLENYPEMEMALLRLQYAHQPAMAPLGVLLQDPVVQYCKWNQDALDRAMVLCPDPQHRANLVKRTVHNSQPKQEDAGCLLEQVAIHLVSGLDSALQQCTRRTGQQYGSASLPSMRRVAVRQAALKVAEQGLGQVLGAISQAGIIVRMVQAHYAKSVAPLLEEVPAQAQLCSRGFASMLRAMEDHIMTTLQAGTADFFVLAEHTLTTEQRRLDFRPSDEVPAPLDQPTDACNLVSSLFAALLQEAGQTLQGSNLVSFLGEVGQRAHKMLRTHMQHFSFSPTGALRWKRDVTEYADALRPAIQASPTVAALFEELAGLVNVLLVAPESLSSLVDGSMWVTHAQALQYIRLREDFKTARVQGKTLAAIFASD